MKDKLIELITIVEELAIKIDGREIAKLNTGYYPPKIEFERISNGEQIRCLMNMKTELELPIGRSERIENLTLEFQEERIRQLEEKIKQLEGYITSHLHNDDIIDDIIEDL